MIPSLGQRDDKNQKPLSEVLLLSFNYLHAGA